jgi:hypothetical protein
MRAVLALFIALAMVGPVRAAAPPHTSPRAILFVGNSLTYVGNTPAVFDALAAANGVAVSSDMIVRGGATLTQRLNDGSVARALAAKHYSAVVLQERGGDLMCAFGPDSCVQSRSAIRTLASMAKKSGAEVFLLGSYQDNAKASELLVAAESSAALEAGIPYIEVSQRLQALRTASPASAWFAPDGMHPGPALALLNATLLHQALLKQLPRPVAFIVNAPIYGSSSGLVEDLRSAESPPPLAATPLRLGYTAKDIQRILPALAQDEAH